MYLHIGNDKIIKKENILFLLDYEGIKDNASFQSFINNIKKENREDISGQNPKTVIITKEDGKIKSYLSNISAVTLVKRSRI